ncbi:hypothetical protein CRH03_16570 [Clostridium sp. HMb25]|nr:hypothetical protein CRH03_16570 [Clostridium sp. HMb25]
MMFWITMYTVGILCLSGIPIYAILCYFEKGKGIQKLILTPILGFCILTAIGRILVGFGIPIKYFSYPLIGTLGGIGAIILLKNRRLFVFDKGMICGGIVVIFVASIGYWMSNPDVSAFLAWDDFLYASHGEMLNSFSVKSAFDAAPYKPYMTVITNDARNWNYLRLSLAIIQGIISSTLKIDAAYTNRLLGIMAALFMYCATWYAGKKFTFSNKMLIVLSVFASVAPGTLAFGYEGFQGAVLMAPFLFLWHFVVYETITHPTKCNYFLCSLVFAAASTIFTEVTISLIIIVFIECFFEILFNVRRMTPFKTGFLILCGGILLNSQYLITVYYHEAFTALNYFSSSHFDVLYPYAGTIVGIQRNLFGTIVESPLGIVSFVLFIVAFAGAIIYIIEQKDIICITIIATLCSAFFFISTTDLRTFNFYRLFTMNTVSIVVFLGLFIRKIKIFFYTESFKGYISNIKTKKIIIISINIFFTILTINAAIASMCFGIAVQTKPIQNSDENNFYYTGIERRFKTEVEYNEYLQQLKRIRTCSKEKLLFSSNFSSLNLWTLSYFGKDKESYFFQPDLDNRYNGNNLLASYQNIERLTKEPENVCIINLKSEDAVFNYSILPECMDNKMAVSIMSKSKNASFASVRGPYDYQYDDSYLVKIFSVDEQKVKINLRIYSEEDMYPIFVEIDNERYRMKKVAEHYYILDVDWETFLKSGINQYAMSFVNMKNGKRSPVVASVTDITIIGE